MGSKIQETLKQDKEPEWHEVKEGDLFEFQEKGDSITGKLFHMEKDVGQHKSKLYHLKLDDGTVKKIWGSKILDDRLLTVDFGTIIKVVFEGEVKPEKGRAYKDFKVFKQG